MNREFENSGREMPYRLPPQSLEALHERILSRTSRRPASPPRTVRRYCLTAAKVTYGGPCTVETVSDNIQRRK